ncbi:MAG: hypothetical protein V4652_00885 [Bacteroidota bacterium]
MNKEFVKTELENEINSIINSNLDTFKNTSGFLNKLEMWSTKFGEVEDFTEVISKKLNEIIERYGIVFRDENEKNELIAFLKPTIQELIVKNIKK